MGQPYTRRVALAFLGILLGTLRGAAQTPGDTLPNRRLTVQPRTMATGTRNERAGEQALDSLREYLVYVPEQCVGAQRCPLVVALVGGGEHSQRMIDFHRPFADKYGMILLALEPIEPPAPVNNPTADLLSALGVGFTVGGWGDSTNLPNTDLALKQVLRKFAIDPDRIAVIGSSNGAGFAMQLARYNLDVFSRVAALATGSPRLPVVAHTSSQFFVVNGLPEGSMAKGVEELRRQGYAVKELVGLHGHQRRTRETALAFQWFHDSWADSTVTARLAPSALADSVPVLTPDIVARMTTFWQHFSQEAPDSIQPAAFRKELNRRFNDPIDTTLTPDHKLLPVLVGQRQIWVADMGDMPAFATKYPSVAAALRAAGLTAQQEEAYRAAFAGVMLTQRDIKAGVAGPVAPVVQQNLMFVEAHADEVKPLEALMGLDVCSFIGCRR